MAEGSVYKFSEKIELTPEVMKHIQNSAAVAYLSPTMRVYDPNISDSDQESGSDDEENYHTNVAVRLSNGWLFCDSKYPKDVVTKTFRDGFNNTDYTHVRYLRFNIEDALIRELKAIKG